MSTNKITVVIADDHHLYLEGLRMLLNTEDGIIVVGEACNGKELIAVVAELQPDVIITDLAMPGVDGIKAIKELAPNKAIGIVAITTFESEFLLSEAITAGALGFVFKNAQDGEMVEAVRHASRYKTFHCQRTKAKLASMINNSKYDVDVRTVQQLFTEKEKEIIRYISEDKSSEEIGRIMFMSKRTVDGIRAKILLKANVKTALALYKYAVKNALYFPADPDNIPPL